ncbi:MAG: DUF692 family multinuclear iron-containing protein [Chloroflexota bacterium]
MIQLAVSDRPMVRHLIRIGEISLDYLEVTGSYANSAPDEFPHQPFLLHNPIWNWSLAHRDCLNQKNALATSQHMIDCLQVPWLSLHLGFSAEEVMFDERMKPATPLLSQDAVFETICDNLKVFVSAIPVPILIENLDYNPGGAYEYICHPAFIASVLETTNLAFLLDIAHARVSATRLGMPINDYLDQLPFERVRQIHVSGPRWQNGLLIDAHESLLDEDYVLLESVLKKTEPCAVTLEYGKEEAVLKKELSRLKDVLGHTVH